MAVIFNFEEANFKFNGFGPQSPQAECHERIDTFMARRSEIDPSRSLTLLEGTDKAKMREEYIFLGKPRVLLFYSNQEGRTDYKALLDLQRKSESEHLTQAQDSGILYDVSDAD